MTEKLSVACASDSYQKSPDVGDFFVPEVQLPEFDHQLQSYKRLGTESCKRGTLTKDVFMMSDGTHYPVVTGTPKKEMSDTAITFTTAWLTSTEGHNLRTLMRMMEMGHTVVMIGPEGQERNHEISRSERFKQALVGSQPKIAYDLNRILDHKLGQLNVRDDQIMTLGESRGAMLERGKDIPNQHYSGNRRVVYADTTAPCFARRPSIGELPGIATQLIPEAATLGKLAIQLLKQPRLRHYGATIHSDPEYYAKEIFKIPQLLSGDAGMLEAHSRQDTPMHVRIYKGDGWSQEQEWTRIYGSRPNVYVEVVDGYHLDIARDDTLDNIELRHRALMEARGYDGDFSNVNFEPILALHKHAKHVRACMPESGLQPSTVQTVAA